MTGMTEGGEKQTKQSEMEQSIEKQHRWKQTPTTLCVEELMIEKIWEEIQKVTGF